MSAPLDISSSTSASAAANGRNQTGNTQFGDMTYNPPNTTNIIPWIIGGVIVVVLGLAFLMRRKKP